MHTTQLIKSRKHSCTRTLCLRAMNIISFSLIGKTTVEDVAFLAKMVDKRAGSYSIPLGSWTVVDCQVPDIPAIVPFCRPGASFSSNNSTLPHGLMTSGEGTMSINIQPASSLGRETTGFQSESLPQGNQSAVV